MKLLKPERRRVAGIVLAAAALWLASCSTPKDIAYFQDAEALNGMAVQAEQQFRLRPGDKICIVVNSTNPMLEQQFSLTTMKPSYTLGSSSAPRSASTPGSSQMVAYTIDEQGTIEFPVLGKISVGGKTRNEVAEYIQDRLIARDLVSDPIVTVEYVNIGVNVLGEVKNPGHIDIDRDQYTIVDAIAKAGDLTITGDRRTVTVTRQVDGVNQVYVVDLTNMQSTLTSPAYYLQQNDLVYVAPNSKRMRESKASGNTFNTPAVWISIVSLLATITALIFK